MQFALVFLALVTLSQAGVPMFRGLDERIVNGEDVKEGEIPYQVSLQTRSSSFHFCGGSVLNKNYVITAAHCVQGKSASSIKVIAGTVNRNEPKSVHLAVEIIIHKEYSPSNSWINDIALIKVNVPFVESNILKYVPLPEHGQNVSAQSVAIISGWGSIIEGGPSPVHLQRTELRISAQDYCSEVYKALGYVVHGSHICANHPEISTGACHGDSGGPLTVGGKLVGLASWTIGCGSIKNPTVYTRVPDFIDWIKANAV